MTRLQCGVTSQLLANHRQASFPIFSLLFKWRYRDQDKTSKQKYRASESLLMDREAVVLSLNISSNLGISGGGEILSVKIKYDQKPEP